MKVHHAVVLLNLTSVDVSIKKNKHGELMSEVEKGAALKAAETNDRSAPVIEEGVSVKKVDRQGFLSEVAKGAENLKKA